MIVLSFLFFMCIFAGVGMASIFVKKDIDYDSIPINDPIVAQPAITFFQIALFELYKYFGVNPDLVIVQAGTDCLYDDPQSNMSLSNFAYWQTVSKLKDISFDLSVFLTTFDIKVVISCGQLSIDEPLPKSPIPFKILCNSSSIDDDRIISINTFPVKLWNF
mgnify:CR=1 FL=1